MSREAYRHTWRALYPDWPWTDREYHKLIVHELTHRAHEELALLQHGSAEAMGPTWFFEGLAVACASQFDLDAPPLTVEELKDLLGEGRTPSVSYPLYGRLVRSLAAHYGWSTLIGRAGETGFPDILWTSSRRVR